MAERSYFFNSTNDDRRVYDAEDWASYFRRFLLSGVYDDGDELAVSADGTGMFVTVGTGSAFLEGYLYINDAPLRIDLDAAEPSVDRIDRIILRLDRTQGVRAINAAVLKGEPQTDVDISPALPAMRKDEYVWEFPLAQVRIYAGKSFVEGFQITDERTKAIHAFSPEQIGTYSAETLDQRQIFKITPDDGGFNYNLTAATDDLLSISGNLATFYSTNAAMNHPPTTASMRGLYVNGAGSNYGEIIALGNDGSIWRNSKANGLFAGWNKILGMKDHNLNTLWTGAAYPTVGAEIKPSKKLSECRNGWILLWSDYDYGVGANDFQYYHSIVHKGVANHRNGGGNYFGVGVGQDATTVTFTIKHLNIYDDKIVGGDNNNASGNFGNDATLRAIYEY